jgi:hypothetical protein
MRIFLVASVLGVLLSGCSGAGSNPTAPTTTTAPTALQFDASETGGSFVP